jgi:hypothetical protein
MKKDYEVLPITEVKNNDILIEHGGLFRVFNRKVSRAHSPDKYGETVYFESEYLGPYKGSTVSIPAHWRTKDRPWIVQGNKNRPATRIIKKPARKKNPNGGTRNKKIYIPDNSGWGGKRGRWNILNTITGENVTVSGSNSLITKKTKAEAQKLANELNKEIARADVSHKVLRKKNPIGAAKPKGFILVTYNSVYNDVLYALDSMGNRMTFDKKDAKQWKTENGAAAASVKVAKGWGDPVVSFPVNTSVAQIKSVMNVKRAPRKRPQRKKNPANKDYYYVFMRRRGNISYRLNGPMGELFWVNRKSDASPYKTKSGAMKSAEITADRMQTGLEMVFDDIGVMSQATTKAQILKACGYSGKV